MGISFLWPIPIILPELFFFRRFLFSMKRKSGKEESLYPLSPVSSRAMR